MTTYSIKAAKILYRLSKKSACLMLYCIICITHASALFQIRGSQVRVEFRLAETSPGPGLIAAKVGDSPEIVYLHKRAIITDRDIIWARVGEEPNVFGLYEISVGFNKIAAKRMATATEPRKGLLAMLIDGKVIAAMSIHTRINDKAIISGPMTKKESEDLATMLNKISA